MTVGVIFLSLGSTPELRQMTQNAVDSCVASDPDTNFRVLVCESVSGINYAGAAVTHPPTEEPFNYNRYMNICRSHVMFKDCEYIALCNNDLLFERGWASIMVKTMKKHNVLSACPKEPLVHKDVPFEDGVCPGYGVTAGYRPIAGWCIFQNMRIYDILGGIDESAEFWHADTFYGAQLNNHNIKHILVEGSVVHHLEGGSNTIQTFPTHQQESMTTHSAAHKRVYPQGNFEHKLIK